MLATVLQQDFGTFYNPERAEPQLKGEREPNDIFFADSRDVFLNGLLAGKYFGTCASLPVLYTVVAQRLGYPVKLATAAGHFFVHYEEGGEHNVEATSIGFNTQARHRLQERRDVQSHARARHRGQHRAPAL